MWKIGGNAVREVPRTEAQDRKSMDESSCRFDLTRAGSQPRSRSVTCRSEGQEQREQSGGWGSPTRGSGGFPDVSTGKRRKEGKT